MKSEYYCGREKGNVCLLERNSVNRKQNRQESRGCYAVKFPRNRTHHLSLLSLRIFFPLYLRPCSLRPGEAKASPRSQVHAGSWSPLKGLGWPWGEPRRWERLARGGKGWCALAVCSREPRELPALAARVAAPPVAVPSRHARGGGLPAGQEIPAERRASEPRRVLPSRAAFGDAAGSGRRRRRWRPEAAAAPGPALGQPVPRGRGAAAPESAHLPGARPAVGPAPKPGQRRPYRWVTVPAGPSSLPVRSLERTAFLRCFSPSFIRFCNKPDRLFLFGARRGASEGSRAVPLSGGAHSPGQWPRVRQKLAFWAGRVEGCTGDLGEFRKVDLSRYGGDGEGVDLERRWTQRREPAV